ncbi:helicase-related protein [candidate division KSB1 bacterium]
MNNINIGSLVKFRGREWIVMPSQEKDMLCLRPLTGSDKDICGVYLPIEAENIKPTTLPLPSVEDIGDHESAKLLRDAARLLLRHGTGPFRCMGQLLFRPRPYQLVPLLMALKLDRVRMLIADDVGVGKTIEATLIGRELLDRGEIQRMAVICPPYLCKQWEKEFREKFNIDAVIIGTNSIARLERKLPRENISIFEYYKHIIISVDFIKSRKYRNSFLLHCPGFVIIDEAHGCARPGGHSTGQKQRYELIKDLTKDESRHIVLVTATPHSGIEESFLSLLGFINPEFEQLDFDAIQQNQRIALAQHFIQRRRADVEQWLGDTAPFPKRDSEDPGEKSFELSSYYNDFFVDVYNFTRGLVLSGKDQTGYRNRIRFWAALSLLRCVMSSPAAAKTALLKRLENIYLEEGDSDTDHSDYIFDKTDVQNFEDTTPTHIIEEGELSFSENEKRKLREFAKAADNLKGENDTKLCKTEEIVRKLLNQGFKPIIFCRFIPTSDYVAEELQKRLSKDFKKLHIISVTGSVSDEERQIRVEELCKSQRRILVATDCLSEGINLQEGFNAVIHYDLPWNPNRLEQREGRVDRFGQLSKVVKTCLLYGEDNPIDGSVLNVLLRKAKVIHHRLGITVPIPVDSETVIETVLHSLFFRGEPTPQLRLFDDLPPVIEFHREWDRAADRERKSRTIFAHHSIKPEEVSRELYSTDSILGNPQDIKNFIYSSCQRLGIPVNRKNGIWVLDAENFPSFINTQLRDKQISKIGFNQPVAEGVIYIHRNHPLTSAFAEFILENAINKNGNRDVSGRCGIVRSHDVKTITLILLIRIRYLITNKDNITSISEECQVVGFSVVGSTEELLSSEIAEKLFMKLDPSGNLSIDEKNYWLNTTMQNFSNLVRKLDVIGKNRADYHQESYDRIRKTIKGQKISIEPLFPADILSLTVVVPSPKQ